MVAEMFISGETARKYLAIIWMGCHLLSVLKYIFAEHADRSAQIDSRKETSHAIQTCSAGEAP